MGYADQIEGLSRWDFPAFRFLPLLLAAALCGNARAAVLAASPLGGMTGGRILFVAGDHGAESGVGSHLVRSDPSQAAAWLESYSESFPDTGARNEALGRIMGSWLATTEGVIDEGRAWDLRSEETSVRGRRGPAVSGDDPAGTAMSIPETAAAFLGALGSLLLLRRRRARN